MNRTTLIGAALLAVLLAVGCGVMFDYAMEFVNTPLIVLVSVECLILGLALVLRPERQMPFLCDPVVLFVFFQSQFFVVGPLALPFTSSLWVSPASRDAVLAAVGAFIGLLVMFLVGYHAPIGSLIAERLPTFSSGQGKFSGRWVERALLVVCLGACAVYIPYQGGLSKMLNRGYGAGEAGAIFMAPFLLLVMTTLLIAWRLFSRPAPRWRDATLLIGVLSFEVLYWGFLLGQRKWLFHLFFGLVTIVFLRRGRQSVPRFVFPTVLLILVAYLSIWGTLRGRPLASLVSDQSDSRYGNVAEVQNGYFDSVAGPFETACLVMRIFPEREPFRYGKTLLVALLSPIPRAIWPTKPIGLGKELTWYLGSYYAATYDPSKTFSITPTLVGDLYANLGIAGVLLGGLLYGIGFRVVTSYAVTGMKDGLQHSPARVLIPAIFISSLVELRAETAMIVVFNMYALLPLVALLPFVSFRPEDLHPSTARS